MTKEQAEELTQAVGQSVSGAWRRIAALQRLGAPKALGLTTKEWVEQRLDGDVKRAAATLGCDGVMAFVPGTANEPASVCLVLTNVQPMEESVGRR